jgi:hypothetical protein
MVAKDTDVINMWERKILKVYGPVTEKEVGELQSTNQEVKESYKTPDLVVDIKMKILE